MMRTRKRSASERDLLRAGFERDGRLNLGDGISVFRHPKSGMIHADYRLPSGKRTRGTTGTNILELAITAARRRYKELTAKALRGEPVTLKGPSVGSVIQGYVEALEARLAAGDESVKPELSVLRGNLLPFWNREPLSDLSRQAFYAWENWRKAQGGETTVREYERGGRTVRNTCATKAASDATLRREKNYFVRALTWASDQLPPLVSDEVVDDIRHLPRQRRRPRKAAEHLEYRWALSDKDQRKLLAEFERWEELERLRALKLGEKGRRKNYHRRLMARHVRLLLSSGMRPGAEILELRWCDLRTITLEKGEETIFITLCGDGKTGRRAVMCNPDSVAVVRDLKRLLTEFGFPTEGAAPLWPSLKGGIVHDMNGSFKSALRRLKVEDQVLDEPLYLCRHTYITAQLAHTTSDIIATNCGTSVEMIERHYKHLKVRYLGDKLVPPNPDNPLGLRGSQISDLEKLAVGCDGQLAIEQGHQPKGAKLPDTSAALALLIGAGRNKGVGSIDFSGTTTESRLSRPHSPENVPRRC